MKSKNAPKDLLDKTYIQTIVKMAVKWPRVGSAIYFLLKGKEVVYVGQSIQAVRRVSSHQVEKQFNRVFFLKTPRQYLDEVETFWIGVLKPKYNKSDGPFKRKTITATAPAMALVSITCPEFLTKTFNQSSETWISEEELCEKSLFPLIDLVDTMKSMNMKTSRKRSGKWYWSLPEKGN